MKSSKRAVVIVGHGSRLPGFEEPMEMLARDLKKDGRFFEVVCAYLEITPPSIREAIGRCVAIGADDIRVLPFFLLKGKHTQTDIPLIVNQAAIEHRGLARIALCPYLGYDKKILELAEKRLKMTA